MTNSDFREFLTPKQQLFCDEYLTDMNATAAALRAGYSASTALNGQLMHMPKIQLHLQQRMAVNTSKAQFTHDMVLRELGKIAFGNMGDYFDEQGGIKPMYAVSDDAKAALWSASVSDAGSGGASGRVGDDNTNNERDSKTNNKCDDNNSNKRDGTGVVKFRMYNKLSALDKIAKHIGFYNTAGLQPETIYTCVTTEQLTADDSFDDAKLQEEIRLKKMQEARVRNQALAKARREMLKMERERHAAIAPEPGDTTPETDGYDPDAVPRDENGNVLCDGAGIPYGPLPKVVAEVPAVVAPVEEKPRRKGGTWYFESAKLDRGLPVRRL